MTLIIIAYLALCIAVCFLKKVVPFLVVAGFVISWYLICYTDSKGAGLLLFAVMCLMATLYRIADKGHLEGRKQRVGKKVYEKEEDRASSNWVYYLIPIFWPILIVRIVLSGKTRPTDMTPYDYEQHLKSNAR